MKTGGIPSIGGGTCWWPQQEETTCTQPTLRHSCRSCVASSSLMSGRCFSRISGRARWLPNPAARRQAVQWRTKDAR